MVSVNRTVGIGDSGVDQPGIIGQRRNLALFSVLSAFTADSEAYVSAFSV